MTSPIRPTYPKEARLRRRREFQAVLGQGDAFPGRQALVRRLPNGRGSARLGISTPKAYGKAIRRNAFRRLVREAFRTSRNRLGAFDFLVSPRRHLRLPTLEGLRVDLLRTLTASPAPPQRKRTRPGRNTPHRPRP